MELRIEAHDGDGGIEHMRKSASDICVVGPRSGTEDGVFLELREDEELDEVHDLYRVFVEERDPIESIYVVEQHNSTYDGPYRTEYTKSLETALDVASDMRDDHRGEEWDISDSSDGKRISFQAIGHSGWVTIRTEPLIDA
jgi:hypothetical protein